jgi:hypothetical protein
MEISEHNQTELTLISPDHFSSLALLPILASLGLVISLGGSFLMGQFDLNALLPDSWTLLLTIIILATGGVSLWLIYLMVDISRRRPVSVCRLDRQEGTLLVIGRVAWRLWWPKQQTIPLADITAVLFHPYDRHNFRLALALTGDHQLTLHIAPSARSDTARIARVLAAFLDAPLEPVPVMG